MRVILKTILFLVILAALLFGGIILFDTVTEYKPTQKEILETSGKGYSQVMQDSIISVFSWNIGYCGLGKDMDFYKDGGKGVRPTEEQFQKYLNGALNLISKYDSSDIFILQEVDTSSKRTYYVNEASFINQFLPLYSSVFAKNYDVRFVPFPLYNPMGDVVSGIMTLSKIKPQEAFRNPYASNYSWPKNVFLFHRCLIYTKYKMKGGKFLVVLNTHNSTYNDDAKQREEESEAIRTMMLDEYNKGNFVIVGGDWNRNPPGFDCTKFSDGNVGRTIESALGSGFLPTSWKCIYDDSKPSNRDVNEPYVKGKTKTTIIDYFIISPNLELIYNKTITSGFEFSDHQPIYMKVRAKMPVAPTQAKIVKEDKPKKIVKKKIVKKKKVSKDSVKTKPIVVSQ